MRVRLIVSFSDRDLADPGIHEDGPKERTQNANDILRQKCEIDLSLAGRNQ